MANIKYLPSSGTTRDVGGMISTTSRKNTWRLIKIEIDSVTWSEERADTEIDGLIYKKGTGFIRLDGWMSLGSNVG